jgi:ATP-dependent protease ClpP protease subunit
MNTNERIRRASEKTDLTPSENQKEAGNYKKGKVTIKGFLIAIENPVGSIRSGQDEDGHKWSIKVKNPYGYFIGTMGKDGDQLDVYLGNDHFSNVVYIIDQINPKTGAFDEHKIMMGFSSVKNAQKAYFDNYEKGWQGLGDIVAVDIETFRKWLKDSKMTRLPASKFKPKIEFRNEISPKTCHILLKGEVEEDVTLKHLQNQVTKEFDILILEIRSPGGNVEEGMKIIQWLDDLSSQGKYIITVVSANAYSIASMIMLAANKRYISTHAEVMVHDPMIPKLEYANASELETQARSLRELESILRELYCLFTGLPDDEIRALMEKETYLSPKDAIKYNFADEIIEIEKKPYEMCAAKIKHKIKDMSKAINILNRVIAMVNGSDVVNQEYGTLGGDLIEIYQQDPAQYSVGDRTNIEEGEFQLADGATIKIKDYVIEDINKETPNPEPSMQDELTTVTVEGGNETVGYSETGQPVFKMNEDGTRGDPVADGEIKLSTGETLIVEGGTLKEISNPKAEDGHFNTGPAPKEGTSQGTIELATLAPEPPAQTPPVVQPEDDKEKKMLETIENMGKTIDSLQKKVSELTTEKLQGQIEEMSGNISNIQNRFKEFEKFENIATEAIDQLAKHTSSNFKPIAKSPAKPEINGSIFQQMKERRGLK